MNIFKRYHLKNILLNCMWVAIGACSLLLLAAAVRDRDKKLCKGLEVNIRGVNNNFFIDKGDVKKIIMSYTGDDITGIEIEGFDLISMEAELKREVWIKNAELYFDNNQVLQASVEEREPVARIFTSGRNTFYIDNTNMILPLSEKLSARLPVFTSFPSDNKVLSRKDSSLLNDVKNLAMEIQQDSFLMGMIDQVDITAQRDFEMIPKIGDQIIVFGDASDASLKFAKLKIFYKKVMMNYGWNRYSMINLQYKGQVVGKLKGRDDVAADSLRTQQIMREVAINAARQASDSLQTFLQDNEKNTTDVSLIQQSIQRDEEEDAGPFPKYMQQTEAPIAVIEKAVVKTSLPKKPVIASHKLPVKPMPWKHANKPVHIPVKPKPATTNVISKPALPKPAGKPPEKPKVLMPQKNDY